MYYGTLPSILVRLRSPQSDLRVTGIGMLWEFANFCPCGTLKTPLMLFSVFKRRSCGSLKPPLACRFDIEGLGFREGFGVSSSRSGWSKVGGPFQTLQFMA
eukprot:4371654-Amphidinium_carterae.1